MFSVLPDGVEKPKLRDVVMFSVLPDDVKRPKLRYNDVLGPA